MITWSLKMIIVLMYIYIHVSNACITVEYDDGSPSVCNQTMTIPCTDLQCALPKMRSGSKMIIGTGDNFTLSCDSNMTMYGMNSIVIVGEGSDNTVITCDDYAGLAFISMNDITIANLTLKECGAWRNSTTQNGDNNSTLKFKCGLYFLDCRNVTMYDVIVTDGPGTGVMMYNTVGAVTIESSQFIHNRVPNDTNTTGSVPGGGGVYIEFTYCLPNTTNFDNCTPPQQGSAIYLINNCKFIDNAATTVEENNTKYILTIGSDHQQFGRGGGLAMFFKGSITNNTFIITNCITKNNMAIWGGGMLVYFLDSARNNSVTIENVTFFNNSIPAARTRTGAGGLKIHYFPQVDSPSNVIHVMNCTFESNVAYFGGGTALTTEHEEKGLNASNGITFTRCKWQNNQAHIGSAIDLSSYTDKPVGVFVTPVFINCSFIGNSNNKFGNITGQGTFHSDVVSFTIEDDNYFTHNRGTALIVVHAVVEVLEYALVKFVDNHGYRGGAMALLGNTWLNMHPNTTVLFMNNSADDKGGAIYYDSAGIRYLNSRKCFIRYFDYKVAPKEWHTNFMFINNTSQNPGHAIYCTTLLTCSRNNTSIIASREVLNETFHWNNTFTYDVIDNNTIATDPANVDISIEELKVAPGQLYHLDLTISDDLDVPRKTVLFAHIDDIDNNSAVNIARTSTYISDNYVELLGSPGKSSKLDFNSITTRVLSFSINVTLAKCPPGFYTPTGVNSSLSECRCSAANEDQRYRHIPSCDRTTLQASLQPQYWAGYIPWKDDTVLVTSKCPSGYCYSNGNDDLPLPTEANNTKLNELICSPNNREGVLCGRCKPGYHIYRNTKDYKCGKCSIKYGVLLQILVTYVPLTVFLLAIILLDINLASGPLNTFVFFSQMLPYLDLYAGGEIPIADAAKPFVEFYQFCYGIFNLQYFESIDGVSGWCTFEYRTALTEVLYGYIVAIWPLVIIFMVWLIIFISDYSICGTRRNVVWCIANCLRQLYRRVNPNGISLSKSFFRGLVTFILLSYTKFTLVTLSLLKPAYLYGPGGKIYDIVAGLDGTLPFFGGDHLYYAIPAVFVLVFIVLLPLILFATYPCLCNCLGIPTHKMMHFFDAFNGAFKTEHRLYYFSLLYFVYRIALMAIFTFATEVQEHYILQQIFASLVLILHVIAQPYKEMKHNIVDVCLLALIPTVISISFFQLFRVTNSDSASRYAYTSVIQIILLYIPLIYLAVVIVYKLYLWRRRRRYTQMNDIELLDSVSHEQDQGGDQANH